MIKLKMKSLGTLLNERGIDAGGYVQKFIDSESIRLCDPKVPFREGTLARSAAVNTVIGAGKIVYSTPYARRLYYHPEYKFQGAPERGGYWFERMKGDGGKEAILRGAATLAGGKFK